MRKNIVLAVFCLMCLPAFSEGQDTIPYRKKWYFKRGAGYSFITGAGQFRKTVEEINGSVSYSRVPFSYGKGLNLSIGAGYEFTPNVSFETCLTYFLGGNSNVTNTYRNDTANLPYYVNQLVKYKANLFLINPSIVINAPSKIITPYVKVGFLAGWGEGSTEYQETAYFYTVDGKGTRFYEWRLDGLQCLGFNSSIGIKLKPKNSDDVHFFFELAYQNLWGTFDKSHLITYMVNNASQLGNLSVSSKEEEFVDSYQDIDNSDKNKPFKSLRDKYIFDSVGFNIGLILSF